MPATHELNSWIPGIKRALLEFLAIFLGVSLSFLADDWREARSERRQEDRVLELLAADLEADLSSIQFRIQTDSATTVAGFWLHSNWDRPGIPADSLNRAWAALHRGGPYSPNRSEYESAKNSGRLQLLRDEALRAEIAMHFEQRQQHRVQVNQICMEFDFDVWHLLRPHYSFATDSVPWSTGQLELPMDMTPAWNAIMRDNALRSAIVQATGFRRMFTAQMQAHREATAQLVERIRSNLSL